MEPSEKRASDRTRGVGDVAGDPIVTGRVVRVRGARLAATLIVVAALPTLGACSMLSKGDKPSGPVVIPSVAATNGEASGTGAAAGDSSVDPTTTASSALVTPTETVTSVETQYRNGAPVIRTRTQVVTQAPRVVVQTQTRQVVRTQVQNHTQMQTQVVNTTTTETRNVTVPGPVTTVTEKGPTVTEKVTTTVTDTKTVTVTKSP